jgi:hypothetical protein
MIEKIRIEPQAQKFLVFKMEDESFVLRALKLAYHADIYNAFEKETGREAECQGAKFLVRGDTVTLYGFSSVFGYMPDHWKPHVVALFAEAYPQKEIVERWDAI